MTEKQTRCPSCSSIYKVSVTQLTVAQGMVCCPKCSTNFNALLHLLSAQQVAQNSSELTNQDAEQSQFTPKIPRVIETNICDIFKRKVENSNIDLKTYLNNLNYFNNDVITAIPNLNLSQGSTGIEKSRIKEKSTTYYIAWGFINFALLAILLFQIVWFNPSLTDRHPLINIVFVKTCTILRCDTAVQRYKKVIISDIKVKAIDRQQTQFRAQLTNQYSKSLELPLIKVTLLAHDQVVVTYIMAPDEYLIESLVGIKRIPKNSPYPIKFIATEPRNAFDQYKLEVIHP